MMDQMHRVLQVHIGQADGGQSAVLQILSDHLLRQERDAQTAPYRRQERLLGDALPDGRGGLAGVRERALKDLIGAAAPLTEEEGRFQELMQRDRTPCQWVIRATDGDMPLLEERDSGEVTGPDGAPHHRQIQLAFQEQLLHELRSVDLHLQLYLREAEAKGPDSGGEIVDPDIDAAAQQERAGVAGLLEQHFHLIREGEEGADIYRKAGRLAGALGLTAVLAAWWFAPVMTALFNGAGDPVLQQTAETGLRLYFIGFLFVGWNLMTAAFLGAVERTGPAFRFSVFRGFLGIVGAALVLSQMMGLAGVWLAFPAAELAARILGRRFMPLPGDTVFQISGTDGGV